MSVLPTRSLPTSLGVSVYYGRSRIKLLLFSYAILIALCTGSLIYSNDLSLGRKPWTNFVKTIEELSHPSFMDIWFGNPRLEYKADDGKVLRVENQPEIEARFLFALLEATWTTFKVATLGSLLAALMGAPLGMLAAKNMNAPQFIAMLAGITLDICRSIHTLVFGLLVVGIVGLGPTAGIVAIALHSMGTFGKLVAENIETMDMRPVEAVRVTGATPVQVFMFAVWPTLLPGFISDHLYVWEYNIRDSTVLGLIGAGGLGLLVSEAVSLFQWGRLTTILIAIIAMVITFDAVSRKIRQSFL